MQEVLNYGWCQCIYIECFVHIFMLNIYIYIEVFKKQLSGILGERIPGHCGKVSNNYMQMQKGVFN